MQLRAISEPCNCSGDRSQSNDQQSMSTRHPFYYAKPTTERYKQFYALDFISYEFKICSAVFLWNTEVIVKLGLI